MNNIEIYKAADGSTCQNFRQVQIEGKLNKSSTVRNFRIVQKRYSKPKTWKCSARLSSVF